ncbi:MAG: precorrin-4 C(11)-methyltransferase [Thermodesulfobacteriota bacterium]|nr:MAG: precorrin-4 C(11)-methyltransferase [Thermodesulfobacteriota bacterium]
MPIAFVGAGPGDPALITLKGHQLLQEADVVIYTGSLVPKDLISHLSALIYNSAGMTLEQVISIMVSAAKSGRRVVRLHTGDSAIYSAIREQIECLRKENIPFEVVPGVTAGFAAAAVLGRELTIPGITQTVIFSRIGGRTPVPPSEELSRLAKIQATLILYLSVGHIRQVQEALLAGGYSSDTPVEVIEKVSWPTQRIVSGKLGNIAIKIEQAGISKTAVILVGKVLSEPEHLHGKRSLLYDPEFSHGYRKGLSHSNAEASSEHSLDCCSSANNKAIPQNITFIYLTPGGKSLAYRLSELLSNKHVLIYSYSELVENQLIKKKWQRGTGFVFIMAAGIVIRTIAPLLKSKLNDPAVVVMDEAGHHAVSLLSGHLGGANELAGMLALKAGGQAVITTASDTLGLVALDMWAGVQDLVPDDRSALKNASAALVASCSLKTYTDCQVHSLPAGLNKIYDPGKARLIISPYLIPEVKPILHLYPRIFALGIGCNRDTPSQALERAVKEFLKRHKVSPKALFTLASIDAKNNETCLLALGQKWDLDIRFFTAEQLNTVPVKEPSHYAMEAVGAYGVAEPSAILAVDNGKLRFQKEKTNGITLALGERAFTLTKNQIL